MKKNVLILTLLLVICLLLFAACGHKMGNRITGGRDIQTFTDCVIMLDGKEIARGSVTQWRDYENSDVVQVLMGGKFYLTHYSNVVLIADPERGALYYGDSEWHGVNE